MKNNIKNAVLSIAATTLIVVGMSLDFQSLKMEENATTLEVTTKWNCGSSASLKEKMTYQVLAAEEETTTKKVMKKKIKKQNTPNKKKVKKEQTFEEWLKEYCYSKHISPYLVMAVIETESKGQTDIIGDNGNSFGLMQIQKRFHTERMDKLGVNDLLDPKQNVIVGVDILLELFRQNDNINWVLMAYNGGVAYANRMQYVSRYALDVTENMEIIENDSKWEVIKNGSK